MVDAEEEEVNESQQNVDSAVEHIESDKQHVLLFALIVIEDSGVVWSQVPVADVASQISTTQSLLEHLCGHSIDDVRVLIWLVEIQKSSLLLEVIGIETVDEMEVVCDK